MMFTDKDFPARSYFPKEWLAVRGAHATKSKEKSPTGDPYSSGVYLFRDGTDISMHRDPDTVKLYPQPHSVGPSKSGTGTCSSHSPPSTRSLTGHAPSARTICRRCLTSPHSMPSLLILKVKAEEMSDEIAKIEVDKQTLSIQQATLTNYKHPRPFSCRRSRTGGLKEDVGVYDRKGASQTRPAQAFVNFKNKKIKDTQPDSDADEELVQLRLTDAEAAVKADSF
jgi:hypothetical protein